MRGAGSLVEQDPESLLLSLWSSCSPETQVFCVHIVRVFMGVHAQTSLQKQTHHTRHYSDLFYVTYSICEGFFSLRCRNETQDKEMQ